MRFPKKHRNWRIFPSSVLLAGCLIAAGYWALGSVGRAATPRPKQGESQSPSDVDAQTVEYSSNDVKISAYLAKPKGGGKHAAVIVVHDTGGLNDGVQAVARRFAQAGFVALAPDLSRGAGAKAAARRVDQGLRGQHLP